MSTQPLIPKLTPIQAKDIPIEGRLFALFVGEYDSGKTWAGLSFPGEKRILEMDGRFQSLRNYTVQYPEESISIYPFKADHGFGPADDLLSNWVTYARIKQPIGDVIMLDSLSMMRRMLLRDAVKLTGGLQKDGKITGRKLGHLQMPTVQDYGYEYEAVWQLVYDGLKQLPCVVIMTAHTIPNYKVITQNGISERVQIGERILATPQLAAQLPILFDEIYYFSKEVDPLNNSVRRFVEFDGDVARTSYEKLKEARKIEITGKKFYDVWKSLISSQPENSNQKGE